MTTYRPVYLTHNALTTGVIVAHVGPLARLARYHGGKWYAREDWHTTIEGAFRRVRGMIATERARPDEGRRIFGFRLDAIEGGLDRGELPWAAETVEVFEMLKREEAQDAR